MKIRSLKIKSILLVLPIIIVLMTAMSFAILEYFEHQFKHSIGKQQFVLVSRSAADLDNKISGAQNALSLVAGIIPTTALNSTEAAERFLDSRPDLKEVFDSNLALLSPDGKLIAETAQRPSRTGADFSFREYMKKTRETWKPFISSPFITSRSSGHPVVMFTAPVFDTQGKPVAILGGSINLMRSNFLGQLASARIGETGYFYLFSIDRTMVMHPDRSRIMKQDIPPGVNKLLDQAINGFEGAGETINSRKVHSLAAFKRLASVNWILAANFPTAEAYVATRNARQTGWWIIAFGTLLAAGIILLVVRYLSRPLESLTSQIRQIGDGREGLVAIATSDEIGDLASTFNSLMAQLRAKEHELKKNTELFQFLSDFSTDWIFWRTPDGTMLYISPAAAHITGYDIDELLSVNMDCSGFIHSDDQALWKEHNASANQGGEGKPIEFRIITKQKEVKWISHICRPIRTESGEIIGVRGCNTDITERKRAETALRESEEKFRLITLSANDAIVMVDTNGAVTFWNPAAEAMFGYAMAEILGKDIHGCLAPPRYAASIEWAMGKWREVGIGDFFGKSIELAALKRDGTEFMVELSLSSVELSERFYAIGVLRDITERKQTEEQLRYMSTHDSLTGLYNRAYFEEELERLCRSRRFPVSVVMADVDNLKAVNDTLGHNAGDAMIRLAAETLVQAFRGDDLVARIGGDEFAVILPESDETTVQGILGRIKDVLEQVNRLDEQFSLGISIGVVTCQSVEELQESMKMADRLMYLDKALRKGSVESSNSTEM